MDNKLVFISHASEDKPVVRRVLHFLEKQGVRCWVTPRDIIPGSDWAEAIMAAVEDSSCIVLVLSRYSNLSPHVRREIEQAVSMSKKIIPLVVEDVKLSRWMQYCISVHQWHDACTGGLEHSLPSLLTAVESSDSSIKESLRTLSDEIEKDILALKEGAASGIELLPIELKPMSIVSMRTPIMSAGIRNRVWNLIEKVSEAYGGKLLYGGSETLLRCFFGYSMTGEDDHIHALEFALKAWDALNKISGMVSASDESMSFGMGIDLGICEISVVAGHPLVKGKAVGEADRLSDSAALLASGRFRRASGEPDWEELRGAFRVGSSRKTSYSSDFGLFGRKKELLKLGEIIRKQRIGTSVNRRGGAIHIVTGVCGEAGIGKTRLLEEFISEAESEVDTVISFAPNLGLAKQGLPISLLRELSSFAGENMLSTVPVEIVEFMDGGVADWRELDRNTLFSAIRDLLVSVISGSSFFLLIDDAHQLDILDRELIKFIVENTDVTTPICFVLAYRPETADGRQTEFSFSRNYAISDEIVLEPLASSECLGFLESIITDLSGINRTLSQKASKVIAQRAGGIPLYLEELTRELFRSDSLYIEDSEWLLRENALNSNMPDSLSRVVHTRLDGLPPSWKRTLQSCAVIGNEIPRKLFDGLSVRLPDEWIDGEALDYLVERRFLLKGRSAFSNMLRFRHTLLRDAALSGVSPENLYKLHKAVAEALKIAYPDSDFHAEAIARHWLTAGDDKQTLLWARKAFEIANSSFRYAAALEWAGIITDLLSDDDEESEYQQHRIELMGILGMREEQIVLLEALLANDEYSKPSLRWKILALAGNVRLEMGEVEKAVALLEEAAELSGEKTSIDQVDMLESLGRAHIAEGDFDRAEESLAEAFDIATCIEYSRGLALVNRSRGELKQKKGDNRESISFFLKALETARKSFERELELSALSNIGRAYYILGELDEAKKYWMKDIEIAKEFGFRQNEGVVTRNIGAIHHMLGELEQAYDKYQDSMIIAEEIRDWKSKGSLLRNTSLILQRQGKIDQAAKMLEEALTLARKAGDVESEASSLSALAALHQENGQREKALAINKECIDVAKSSGSIINEATATGNISSIFEKDGNLEDALAWSKKAFELFEKSGNARSIAMANGNLASLLQAMGKQEEAAPYLERALEMVRSINERLYEVSILSLLSSYYNAKEECSIALEYACEAYTLATEISSPVSQRLLALNLYVYALAIEGSNIEKAVELSEKAVEETSQAGIPYLSASAIAIRGFIRFNTGDHKGALEDHILSTCTITENGIPAHVLTGVEDLAAVLNEADLLENSNSS